MSPADPGAGGDLRELYQEVIFDHNRKPRNFHEMPEADHAADGHNPLCGDQLTVYLRLENDVVADVKPVAEVEALFRDVHAMLTEAAPQGRDFGKLQVLSGVREFPARVKCASLAWHTLHNALTGAGTAKTE
jgi:nitrogen fixation NifU-like protein